MSKSKSSATPFRANQWQLGKRENKAPPDPKSTSLLATLVGIAPRWINDDQSFAIWSASWDLPGEEETRIITVKGALGRAQGGETLHCKGRWREHKQHGWSFEVESYTSALPSNAKGIATWLETRVDGVGTAFATAIVNHFGEAHVFEVLDEDPARLHEVRTKGGRKLPAKQVDRAIEAWESVRALRQIESFLFSHGVSASLADKLYRRYGADVVKILQEDPYRIREVYGVGFKIADQIARSCGVKLDAPGRMEAGVIHVLEEAEGEGHAFLSLKQLFGRTQEALSIQDPRAVVEAAGRLAQGQKIQVEPDEILQQRVYLRKWHSLECRLAATIRHLLDRPARGSLFPKLARDADEFVAALSDDQWGAVEAIRQNRIVLLTGGPGTGKTFSQKVLVEELKKANRQILLCAPTGKAARRMQELTGHEAKTIHRLLEWSPQGNEFLRDETNPLEADCLIVDEVSMLSLDLADALFRAVDENTHLLLVGDPDQLPRVGVGKVLSDLITSGAVPRVHLAKIFRQAARSMIVQNSRRINRGETPFLNKEEAEKTLNLPMRNDFYWVTRSSPEDTFNLLIDFVTNRIPRVFGFDPRHEIMALAPMRDGKVGLNRINEKLEEKLNPPPSGKNKQAVLPHRGIHVGSRIVQTKNDYTQGRETMNGEIGWLDAYDSDSEIAIVGLDDGTRQIEIPRADMDSFQLAWAMTIHKSQGSEFPAVVTPVSSAHYVMLSRALVYTAVTRASQLCVMLGEKKALSMAISKPEQSIRNSTLAQRIVRPELSGELF